MRRERALTTLAQVRAALVACRRCPRLVRHREAVGSPPPARHAGQRYWARPVPSLGRSSARLLLVGLAPAAHGGNRTGRMFTGDQPGGSGDWLARALHAHGFATQPTSLRRGDGFALVDGYITAPVHCAPPGNRPVAAELARCARYLDAELSLLRHVQVVIALGRIAFEAYLAAMERLGAGSVRPRPRFVHGTAHALPWGVTLLACYHPSRQNTQTGRLTWPMFEGVLAEARRRLGPPVGQALPRRRSRASRRHRSGAARPPGSQRPTPTSRLP